MQQREIFETRASTYPNAFWSIWQICCFCFVCCMMYLCICVFVVWCIYVSVCCLLRPEICYVSSSSIAFYFIYWDGIFHWTGSSGIPPDWLASKHQGSSHPCPPSTGFQAHAWLSTWLGSSCLPCKLIDWAPSQALSFLLVFFLLFTELEDLMIKHLHPS